MIDLFVIKIGIESDIVKIQIAIIDNNITFFYLVNLL